MEKLSAVLILTVGFLA